MAALCTAFNLISRKLKYSAGLLWADTEPFELFLSGQFYNPGGWGKSPSPPQSSTGAPGHIAI